MPLFIRTSPTIARTSSQIPNRIRASTRAHSTFKTSATARPAAKANTSVAFKPSLTSISSSPANNTPRRSFAAMATEGKQGVHNLTSKKDFDAAMSDKDQVMVVDFFATWCGPCKVIAPQVVKMSDEHPTARFYKVDVDEVPDVAQELGIRAMPTFVLFKNGEKLTEVVGANPKALEAAIVDSGA